MKYIVSVGAGKNQLPIIKRLKEKGYQVLAFDRDENAIGKKYCDIYAAISTWDYEKAYEWIKTLNLSINGIVALTCSKATYTQHYLIEKLNLKNGIPTDIVKISLDKQQMLNKLGLSFNISEETLLSRYSHYMIKSKVGMASSGIKKVSSQQLIEMLEQGEMNLEDDYIEPFFIGEERRAIVMVENKQIKVYSIISKENYKKTVFTEKLAPIFEREEYEHFQPHIRKVLKKLELNHCVLKIDYINTNGNINILEVDFDVPGDYFETVMSRQIFGYDYLEHYLEHHIEEYVPTSFKNDPEYGEILFVYETSENKNEFKKISLNNDYALIDYNKNFVVPPNSNNHRIAAYIWLTK